MVWLAEIIGGFIVVVLLGRLLNARPRICKIRGTLVAKTAPHIAILTLGLKLRSVIVDPQQRAVRMFARYFWFFPRVRHIPFEVITAVLYGYSDMNPAQGMPWGTAYQEWDMFTVRLRLQNGEEPLLCRFFGQGAWVNDTVWPDWFYWENEIVAGMTQGSQESESRAYADMVSKLIGVPLENG
ncbi:MAG TPA: hypothetical protein VFA07_03100 [Chthonomonadaceae bacterium]|nr:hypothetical protein [Chthonomonadaceae bacterium]